MQTMNTYTRNAAAARCGVTVETIRQAIKRGDLPAAPVPEDALKAWASRSSKETVRAVHERLSRCRWCRMEFNANKHTSCPICTSEE